MRIAAVAAVVFSLLIAAATAAAPAVKRIPVIGWTNGASALAVNQHGDAMVLFTRGTGVLAAAVTPSGRVTRVDPIKGPKCVEGAGDLHAVLGDDGQAFATWTCWDGKTPQAGGTGPFGFEQHPVLARWTLGAPPGPAETLVDGAIDVAFSSLALAPDGTAALLFRETDIITSPDRSDARIALVRPTGAPVIKTLLSLPGRTLNPGGLGVDNSGTFTALIDPGASAGGTHLRVVDFDTSGNVLHTEALPVDNSRALASTSLFVDAAGDRLLTWSGTKHPGVFVQARPAGASAFRPRRFVTHSDASLISSSSNAGGSTILVWRTSKEVVAAVRDVAGHLTRPRHLVKVGSDATSAISASGVSTIIFATVRGWRSAQLSRNGKLSTSRHLPCIPLALQAQPAGRAIFTMDCAGKKSQGYIGRL